MNPLLPKCNTVYYRTIPENHTLLIPFTRKQMFPQYPTGISTALLTQVYPMALPYYIPYYKINLINIQNCSRTPHLKTGNRKCSNRSHLCSLSSHLCSRTPHRRYLSLAPGVPYLRTRCSQSTHQVVINTLKYNNLAINYNIIIKYTLY